MSDIKEDYYKTLGVERNVDDVDLKKKYRSLTMKYHPDRNLDNPEAAEIQFKKIKEAYEVLSDPQKKQLYDQYGHDGLNQQNHQQGGNPFADIFNMFNQGGFNQNHGQDRQEQLTITLEESITGIEKHITFQTFEHCGECSGTGAKKGTLSLVCPTCHGHGMVQMQNGPFMMQQPCPNCKGSGKIIKEHCNVCHGQGKVRTNKTLSVKIPKGIDNGQHICLHGQGEYSNGQNGDLYILINIKPHNHIVRKGLDLSCDIHIDYISACLGTELTIPTIQGEVSLKIPPETQTGKILRLRGKGVKCNNGIGDLLCKIVIETPVKLSDEQKTILNNFKESLNSKNSPLGNSDISNMKVFFNNIKE